MSACCGGSSSKVDKWSGFPDAAFNGNVDKMRELLKKNGGKSPKQFVDAADEAGFTALHRAAQRGQCDAIRFLIDNKANAAAINDVRDTYAQTKSNTNMQQGESALHIACFHRKNDAVAELLKTDAKTLINSPDKKHGMTPLHIAVYRGAKDIAYVLMQNGADSTITDKNGQTAVHMAEFWAEQEAAGISSPHAQHRATLDVVKKVK